MCKSLSAGYDEHKFYKEGGIYINVKCLADYLYKN